MFNGEELTGELLYDIIVAANVELQKLLSTLLTIYGDVHALTNPTPPGTNALYNLLASNFNYLKDDVVKGYVAGKLYTSLDRIDILPDVDSKKLDSSLLLDVLIKYLLTLYSEGICKECKDQCCPDHDHSFQQCKKCKGNGNTPTDKCWHKCKSCEKIAKECQKTICCTSCNTCIPCNKIYFSDDVNFAIGKFGNFELISLTCPWYVIISCLEVAKHFRNLFGHVTIEECKQFIENGNVLNEQFKECKVAEQLKNYVTFFFSNIVKHAEEKLRELPCPSTELKDGVNQTMANLGKIFDCNAFPKQYLITISKSNIFDENDEIFRDRLESRISDMEKSIIKTQITCTEILTKRERMMSVLQNKFPAENFTDKDKEWTEKKCDGDNSKRMMEVISYFPKGCIFKVQIQPGYQIQSVRIRCICTNQELDVKQCNQEESNDDADQNVYCKIKELDDKTMLLKIGNLEDRKEYEIQLQTNQHRYDDKMTIPGTASCSHVNIVGVFIVLTPPLGQSNDPLNCHEGLHGYFPKDSDILTTCISDGAEIKKMTIKEFEEFSKAYQIRNFPKSDDVLVFPLIHAIADPVVQEVAKIFNKFLSTRTDFRALITNLNSKKYIQFCTATDKIVHEDLPYYNRLQVFDQTTASVLNIRVIKSTNLNGDVHKEMERCVIDMQCFVSSHRHNSCSCYIIGVLAFPNLSRADIESHLAYYYPKETRQYMKLFYLSQEDLQDVDHLQQWWYNTYQVKLRKHHIPNFNANSFKNISAQCLATIALTELSPKLPTLLDDPLLQLTSLLLNPDQMEIIQSPSNRKIIVGNYGSGKSIVLDEIAKQKFRDNLHTNEDVLLLYVIWEEFSLLEIQKKILLDKLKEDQRDCSPRLTMISGNMHKIWNDLKKTGEVKFHDFLRHFLEGSGYKTVHILIDELPTDVNIEAVEDLNMLLKRHPNSSVTIAPQSITIDRTSSNKDGELNHNRNCLDLIEMDRFELVKVMRNSMQINAVVNAAQKKLKGIETSFRVHDPSKKNVAVVGDSQSSEWRGASNETKESLQRNILNVEIPSTASQSQLPATMPDPKFEQMAKFFDSDEATKNASSTVRSTYNFHDIRNGNGIKDKKPTLIKLPSEVNFKSEMSAKILRELLQEICLKESAQTMILCNSMEEVRQVSYCLSLIPNFINFVTYIPHLQGVFPTTEERRSVFSKFCNGCCLLTDYTGIKGMEAKRVIIFASQYEHFEMHNITETISRGNVWVYIILHSSGKYEKRETLGSIINELEDKQLFDVRRVEMVEDHTTFDCPCDNTDGGMIYNINQVYVMQQKLKQTFGDYEKSFNDSYPVKKNQKYRYVNLLKRKFFVTEMADVENGKEKESQSHHIIHEVDYEGKIRTFWDVYGLLNNQDYEIFRPLLKYNGSMLNNLRDDENKTFLIHASYSGANYAVKYLTEEFPDDIDVWAVDVRGRNAYHYAAIRNRVDVMKTLLSFDRSKLNVRDNDGDTLLHCAAWENNKRIVKLLLDAGADVDIVEADGETPDRQAGVHDNIRKMIENHRTKNSS